MRDLRRKALWSYLPSQLVLINLVDERRLGHMARGDHHRGRHLVAIRVVQAWLYWGVARVTTHHHGIVRLLKVRIHCWHHRCVNHIICFRMHVWLSYISLMITVRFAGFHAHFIPVLDLFSLLQCLVVILIQPLREILGVALIHVALLAVFLNEPHQTVIDLHGRVSGLPICAGGGLPCCSSEEGPASEFPLLEESQLAIVSLLVLRGDLLEGQLLLFGQQPPPVGHHASHLARG